MTQIYDCILQSPHPVGIFYFTKSEYLRISYTLDFASESSSPTRELRTLPIALMRVAGKVNSSTPEALME